MREERTPSMVSGFFSHAAGLSRAHSRAATATVASCSRVVPNSCICREAASAYALDGRDGLNGVSYGLTSRTEVCLRATLRCVLPYAMTATLQRPRAIAPMACATWYSKDEPPTMV